MRPRAGRLAACLVHQTGARSEHKFAHTPCIRMDTITLAVADDIQSRAGSVGKVENGGTRSSALGVEGMVASRWQRWSRPQAEPIFACPRCLYARWMLVWATLATLAASKRCDASWATQIARCGLAGRRQLVFPLRGRAGERQPLRRWRQHFSQDS